MDSQLKTMVAQLDSTCNDRAQVINDIRARLADHLEKQNADAAEENERMRNASDEQKGMYLVMLTFTLEMGKLIERCGADTDMLMRSQVAPIAKEVEGGLFAAHAVRRCEINLNCETARGAWHNILALAALRSQLLASVREVVK